MVPRICTATGIVLVLIGLMGFLWPRRETRRPMAAVLVVNGTALYLAGVLPGGRGDGRAAALLVLGLLPVTYLVVGSLRRGEGR